MKTIQREPSRGGATSLGSGTLQFQVLKRHDTGCGTPYGSDPFWLNLTTVCVVVSAESSAEILSTNGQPL